MTLLRLWYEEVGVGSEWRRGKAEDGIANIVSVDVESMSLPASIYSYFIIPSQIDIR